MVWSSPYLDTANTSYVERHNLTMRMSLGRSTRLTNAFSKRLAKHCAALDLGFYWYKLVSAELDRLDQARQPVTPAMAAGLTDRPCSLEQLVELVDERAPTPRRPRTYRKRQVA